MPAKAAPPTTSKATTASALNREGWLTELAKRCETYFKGLALAPYRLTCGWPSRSALPSKSVRIGECHGAKSSKGGTHELFISPLLDKPVEVAGVVCHEMAHVAAGIDAKHGKGFKKVCDHIGLTAGKPTTAGPGPYLLTQLDKLCGKLGPYPHSAMIPGRKVTKAGSEVRLVCVCGCRVVMSMKWFVEVGAPTCGCGELLKLPDE